MPVIASGQNGFLEASNCIQFTFPFPESSASAEGKMHLPRIIGKAALTANGLKSGYQRTHVKHLWKRHTSRKATKPTKVVLEIQVEIKKLIPKQNH